MVDAILPPSRLGEVLVPDRDLGGVTMSTATKREWRADRRTLLRTGFGAAAAALALRPVTGLAAQFCAAGERTCDWPSGTPGTHLGKLGKMIVLDKSPYNTGGTIQQLEYWDDSLQWHRRHSNGWRFKRTDPTAGQPRVFTIDRSIRIPYAGAKDRQIPAMIVDEHWLIGLDADDSDTELPADTIVFMDDSTTKPAPAAAFARLAWLMFKACSPPSTIEWRAKNDWDSNPATIPEDRDGAIWNFRGRPVSVEASFLLQPLFLKKTDNKFYRARLLVGYEGSGGY
jgi:hypothetical protein